MKNILILDNKGMTADRYTILDKKTGDVYGCSAYPFHPCGIGGYSHNVADSYWRVAYGCDWRKRIAWKKAIKYAIDIWISEFKGRECGTPVSFDEVPADVQQYIAQSLTETN